MLAEAVIDDRIAPSALVVGGASSTGKAVCELLSRNGYLVAVADPDELGAHAVADACGGLAFAVDVTDEASVIAMIERSFEALGGRLDALATIPSVAVAAQSAENDAVAFGRVHASLLMGTYLCIREAAKHMQAGGRVCTVAALAGNHGAGIAPGALRAATVGAVVALTRAFSSMLAPSGIGVNGVAPAQASTAAQIAEAVLWLLSPRAAGVRGEIITLAPALP